MDWAELIKAIDANESFVISSHQSLDGDCVGSQLAFLWYLKSKGKRAACYCSDPLPHKLSFLTDSNLITQNKPAEKFDVLMVLDCSNISRLGWDECESAAKMVINIDHHRDNKNFGALNFVDSSAAATGEIIFSFFRESGITIPKHVAEALYAAVMTDTGGFRFNNTSSSVLRVCADLIELGVENSAIYEKVYSRHTPQALMLQSRIWSTLKFHLNGKVCSLDMPMSVLDEIGAKYSDSEGMADNTVTGEGVEVGIMTKHTPEETHISLRSTGRIDVGRIAQRIAGGGGHSCAAGCTIKLPYEQAMGQMLGILAKELGM
ncbi:MAG: bifunctional oligoribonuclease/PAP phosphatase NrnA [Chitinispirillia bacterium]|nr:bifunctional oligoribonuclease/PAP phosphatase NrnA [Chitinispirillia bacterium]MCL2240934.1 bifunctional oligoribonuclease/PAP phosphatase NrnA [Chitinispirillia bacterium]MCL2242112.1 bifunctional oligoribonuclease/PAP phosphatase NrnA [Chitinispirillia bacterium]